VMPVDTAAVSSKITYGGAPAVTTTPATVTYKELVRPEAKRVRRMTKRKKRKKT